MPSDVYVFQMTIEALGRASTSPNWSVARFEATTMNVNLAVPMFAIGFGYSLVVGRSPKPLALLDVADPTVVSKLDSKHCAKNPNPHPFPDRPSSRSRVSG